MPFVKKCAIAIGCWLRKNSVLRDYSFECNLLVDTVEFDAALVEDIATQDDLVVEEFTAIAVNFHRPDGGVADRQIEIGCDALTRFTADTLNDGSGTADLQLQGGDDRKWN